MDSGKKMVQRIAGEEIDLAESLGVLWERKGLMAGATILGVIIAVGISFSRPNAYLASATILPTDSSSEPLASGLPSVDSVGGLFSQLVLGREGTVTDKLVALLSSRTVAENAFQKHRLIEAYFPRNLNIKDYEGAESLMRKRIKIESEPKSGIIRFSVKFVSPVGAAAIANAYIEELGAFLQANALTTVKRKRYFLDKKVAEVSDDLSRIETALISFQEKHGLVALDAQTQAAVQSYSSLRSQLMAKENELLLQSTSLAPNDYQLIGIRQEVAQLRENMQAIEHKNTGAFPALREIPKLGIRYAHLQREITVKQKMLELLSQQLELAKIEEAKEPFSFQVIDRAIVPRKKSGPNHKAAGFLGAISGALIGAVLVLRTSSPSLS